MGLKVNLRHLEAHEVRLEGRMTAAELDLETLDEVVRADGPLEYALEAQKVQGGLLVQGRLSLMLACQCVRCLRPFRAPLVLQKWTCHLPFQGEDKARVVGDCVDLTPYVREDILLEIPQHPLCDPECRGLPLARGGGPAPAEGPGAGPAGGSPAWTELNKLKF
jgi:uncharacterized protein